MQANNGFGVLNHSVDIKAIVANYMREDPPRYELYTTPSI
jgi:hypothetical protein